MLPAVIDEPLESRRRVWSVRMVIEATEEEAEAVTEALARALCPDDDHDGPCPIPWTLLSQEVTEEDEPERSEWLEQFDAERPPPPSGS